MPELESLLREHFAGDAVDDVARQRVLAALHDAPARARRTVAAVAGVVVVVALVSVLVVAGLLRDGTRGVPAATPTAPHASVSTGPPDYGDLTQQQFEAAYAIARREANRLVGDGSVRIATVTIGPGTETQSNVGPPCTSGTLLHIAVIGDFPNVVTGGHLVLPGESVSPEEFSVHSIVITADASTLEPCLQGVQTGDVQPDPDATVLFTG